MISLGKHRSYRNPKTKKNIKPFDASLTNFQDFLNKSLPKPGRTTSKMFSPNKTKMEKLNFSSTAMSTTFLPPKSVDKHRFSSTNRGFMTYQEDFLKLETPKNKQKSAFFADNQPEQVQLTQRQIKQKVENNAMQRFQQLFRKQNNNRVKKIESQQSKRLIGLLEKTSRINRQNQPQQNFNNKPNKPYFATSKKTIKNQQDDVLQENRNQRQMNERVPVSQHKNVPKATMDENTNEIKKNFKFEIKRKNSLAKQKQIIEEVKQIIRQKQVMKQKDQNQKNQINEENKVNFNNKISNDQRNVQTTVIKQQIVNKQKQVLKKKEDQIKQIKQKETFKINNQEKQVVRNKIENKKDNEKPMQLKMNSNTNKKQKQQLKILKKDNTNQTRQTKKYQKSQNLNKEQNHRVIQQKIKKNSFQAQGFQIEQVKTYQKGERIEQQKKSNEKIQKQKYSQQNRYDDVQVIAVDKNVIMKGGQSNVVDNNSRDIKKNNNNNNNTIGMFNNNNSMKSNKQSITIKSSRDMKVSLSEKNQQKVSRYQKLNKQQDDDLDLDVVEIGNNNNIKNMNVNNVNVNNNNNNYKSDHIIQKQTTSKVNKKQTNNTNNTNNTNKQTKVSLTSLAEQVQRIQGKQSYTTNNNKSINKVSSQNVTNKSILPYSKKVQQQQKQRIKQREMQMERQKLMAKQKQQQKQHQLQQKQQQQQQQQQNQQQQQPLLPADQLDYLICLVQNLGRYYNKSKQFYSLTQSSMVEIVMNHKLAAYYNSQQFYYYLNKFVEVIERVGDGNDGDNNDDKLKFYSLSHNQIQQALQDQTIQQAIQDLKSSLQVAKKLIKHTHEKAKIYLKKQQKQLRINKQINYHQKCITYIRQQFMGLYKLYQQRKSKTLAQRLCYLIEIYCILKSLNEQQCKQFQDLQDIQEDNYHQHIVENRCFVMEVKQSEVKRSKVMLR